MSDDFAICNQCGAYNENVLNPEESLIDCEEELADYISTLNEYKSQPQTENKLKEIAIIEEIINETKDKIKFYLDKISKQESKCLVCNQWTTFSYQHVDYKN